MHLQLVDAPLTFSLFCTIDQAGREQSASGEQGFEEFHHNCFGPCIGALDNVTPLRQQCLHVSMPAQPTKALSMLVSALQPEYEVSG